MYLTTILVKQRGPKGYTSTLLRGTSNKTRYYLSSIEKKLKHHDYFPRGQCPDVNVLYVFMQNRNNLSVNFFSIPRGY